MGSFWKIVAMGATAAAAVVVAKEIRQVERTERGEDCSPVAVVKGIGTKIGNWCKGCCAVAQDDPYDFDDFDDFEDFEDFESDDSVDFDTTDMESDKLTDDGYIMEFDAAEEPKPAEEPAAQEAPEAAEEEPVPEVPASEEDEEDEESISTDE